MNPSSETKDLMTLEDTEAYFGLSRRKLRRLLQTGSFKFVVHYANRKLILTEEFKKYLAQPGVKESLKNGKPRYKKRFKTQSTAER